MKIGLIEDRLSRMEQFSQFDIASETSVEIITNKDFESLTKLIDNENLTSLDKFDCLIVHRTALTNTQRDAVKKYCESENKPLVFFSGGISTSMYNDQQFPFLHINSKDLYSVNLKLFIEETSTTQNINLLILQFGSNWMLNLLLSLRDMLNRMRQMENNSTLRVTDLDINSYLRDLLLKGDNLEWLDNSYEKLTLERIDQIRKIVDDKIDNSI